MARKGSSKYQFRSKLNWWQVDMHGIQNDSLLSERTRFSERNFHDHNNDLCTPILPFALKTSKFINSSLFYLHVTTHHVGLLNSDIPMSYQSNSIMREKNKTHGKSYTWRAKHPPSFIWTTGVEEAEWSGMQDCDKKVIPLTSFWDWLSWGQSQDSNRF